MRTHRMVGTLVLFILMSLPALAQSTGASVMSVLGDNLRRELTQYQIEGSRDLIRIIDRQSGVEILSVRNDGPQNVAINATIGTYPGMSRDAKATIQEQIALFNYSSQVGTLSLDDRSGVVTMSHNMNPREVPMQQLVRVASICGDVAREQARSLHQ